VGTWTQPKCFKFKLLACNRLRHFKVGSVLTIDAKTISLSLERMDTLHAPWRIQYILGPKRPRIGAGSIFSEIAQSSNDEENYVIARQRTCFAVLNSFPYNCGHLMVIPYKESPDLHGLTMEEIADLMDLVRKCQTALEQTMRPDGFNIGINLGKSAGAGIAEHLHIHIVPRWSGDTNFMAVIGETTVLPEALKDVAGRLRTALNQI
jgi:ATP adenylyltransferase